MLKIYPVILEVIVMVGPLAERIEKRDADLGRQLRRAISSGALNTAEGMYSRGGNRSARYHSALGSMRESLACLEVGRALGYLTSVEPELEQRFSRIIGTLVRLVEPRE